MLVMMTFERFVLIERVKTRLCYGGNVVCPSATRMYLMDNINKKYYKINEINVSLHNKPLDISTKIEYRSQTIAIRRQKRFDF